jgi:MSHA biogenesis protein MshM
VVAVSYRLLQLITDRLIDLTARGKRVVLLIDEAQAMPQASMEALRLLTNLETEKYKLLHIVMFGQPELDEILQRPSIRQLRQRIAFSHVLPHMTLDAVEAYITHRLTVAGYNGAPLFAPAAIKLLYKASRGTPRLINILAHKSLIAGYGQGARKITASQVRAAVNDTEDTRQASGNSMYRLLGIVTSILVGLGVFLYLGWAR